MDSINFMVDKRIFIVGYGLYGSSSGASDYNVRIELKKYGEVRQLLLVVVVHDCCYCFCVDFVCLLCVF